METASYHLEFYFKKVDLHIKIPLFGHQHMPLTVVQDPKHAQGNWCKSNPFRCLTHLICKLLYYHWPTYPSNRKWKLLAWPEGCIQFWLARQWPSIPNLQWQNLQDCNMTWWLYWSCSLSSCDWWILWRLVESNHEPWKLSLIYFHILSLHQKMWSIPSGAAEGFNRSHLRWLQWNLTQVFQDFQASCNLLPHVNYSSFWILPWSPTRALDARNQGM